MEVAFSSSFRKSFRKRVKDTPLESSFWDAVQAFIDNPGDPALRTHKLSGRLKGLWSFSVAYDLRVVFYFTETKPVKAVFVDVGNHDEVY